MGRAKRKGRGRQKGEPKTKKTEDAPSIAVPDEIRTARLLLRKPRATDAPLMFNAYAQDPAVTRYLVCASNMRLLGVSDQRLKMGLPGRSTKRVSLN